MSIRASQKEPAMSEFKTNDYVVLLKEGTKDYLLQVIDHKYTDDLYRVKILKTGQCGPAFKDEIRLAKKEEIAAGHRIDTKQIEDIGDDRNMSQHISPNCKAKDV